FGRRVSLFSLLNIAHHLRATLCVCGTLHCGERENTASVFQGILFDLFSRSKCGFHLNSSANCSANSAGCPPVCQNKTVSCVLKNPVRIKSIIAAAARPV